MNNMTYDQLVSFKNRGLAISFTHPSYSRYREKDVMIQHMMAEYPSAQLLELPVYTQLNSVSKGGMIASAMRVVVYKLNESDTAGATSYRIFTESYVHSEMALLMDCVFNHDEADYHEFLSLIEASQNHVEGACDAAITLLANNPYKVYPTSKCNNWQDDKMPSI